MLCRNLVTHCTATPPSFITDHSFFRNTKANPSPFSLERPTTIPSYSWVIFHVTTIGLGCSLAVMPPGHCTSCRALTDLTGLHQRYLQGCKAAIKHLTVLHREHLQGLCQQRGQSNPNLPQPVHFPTTASRQDFKSFFLRILLSVRGKWPDTAIWIWFSFLE